MVAVLNKRCAGSTTPISTHRVLGCGCLESSCGVGSEARRRVGVWSGPNGTPPAESQSGARTKTLPPALAKAVMGLRAGDRLGPVAVVTTTRTASRVLNADGELVVEIADDQVASGPPDGESMLHSWHEVEVELGPAGKKKDLKQESCCKRRGRPA